VALALDTGARKGAIHDLTWDRVDFARRQIDFQPPGRTLTKKLRPTVPISDRLLRVLQAAHAEASKHGPAHGPVLNRSDLSTGYALFTKSIGMPWVTPHVCRHTWATLAADRGVPLSKVALMLGDSPQTVAKYYVNLTVDDLRGVV
jgi:integrase